MDKITSFISRKLNVDAQYFLSGGFWLLVAQASTVFSSLLVAILFARYLTGTEYGVYRYIIGLAVLLGSFSLTGISQAVLQASARGYGDFLKKSMAITLKYSTGISLFSFIGFLYYSLNGNQTLSIGCFLIAVFHPFSQLFLNVISHLYGKTQFEYGAYAQIAKSIFVSSVSLTILFVTRDILWLLGGYFISQAISSLSCYFYFKPKKYTDEIPAAKYEKHISYAKHTSARNLLTGISTRVDSILIFQQFGAAELALYSISTLLPEHIRGSFKNLQTLLIPKYTKHSSVETLKKNILPRSLQLFLILVVISVLFIGAAPYIFPYLFPTYPEAVKYAQLLSLSFPASIFLIPFGAMQALQLEKKLYIFQLLSSITQIALLIILVFYFGFIGAIYTRIISQYFRVLLAYLLICTTSETKVDT